jgi:hypothetical protein
MECESGRSTEDRVPRQRRQQARFEPLRQADALLALLSAQGGRCAVCGEDLVVPPNAADSLTGVVDCDSASDTVRGLLCRRCHTGLTLFGADSTLMQRAAAYLDRRSSGALTGSAAR